MEIAVAHQSTHLAKHKLAKHKELGHKSNLSIMEVAQLMDLITFGTPVNNQVTQSLFFNYPAN